MSAERGQDHLLLPGLLAAHGLLDGRGQRVRRLGRRHDALGAGEEHAGGEALRLRLGDRLDLAGLVEVADQRAHAVVAQPAGVDRVRHEVVAERVHLHQRRHPDRVAEVVRVRALGQRRARGRLDRAHRRRHPAGPLLPQEREHQPAEVRAAAGAPDQQVGGLADLGELQQRLLADDRLVHQHVVEHAAERVVDRRVLRRDLDGLADRDAERPGGVRVLGQDRAPGLGQVRRARVHGAAERLDHHPAVGLLVVRRPHLPHLALEAVLRAGERERGAPLAGAGLGGQLLDARLRVVVRLRHGGVRLVRAGGGDAFVLVVDPRRRPERLLQPVRAVQRARPPQPVDVEHLVGDVDVLLGRHLLHDQVHREQRRQVVGPDRLAGAGVQHRRRRRRQVVQHVVPARRHLALVEQDLVLLHLGHDASGLATNGRSDTSDSGRSRAVPSSRAEVGVEPEPGRVERPQPQVAAPLAPVGALERPARRLDADRGDRFGREGQRLAPHHLELGAWRRLPGQQVEHHVGGEPGGADAEAGEAGGVRHSSLPGQAVERAEPRGRVDRPGPLVAEPESLELRERGEEVLGEEPVGLRSRLVGVLHPAAEVVHRVVPAPQDAVVGREPVVVEQVGRVAESLPARPADRARAARRSAVRSSGRSRRRER